MAEVINIHVDESLAVDALEKFNDVQMDLRKKNIKIHKKQFYAFLLRQGLSHFSLKALESALTKPTQP